MFYTYIFFYVFFENFLFYILILMVFQILYFDFQKYLHAKLVDINQ